MCKLIISSSSMGSITLEESVLYKLLRTKLDPSRITIEGMHGESVNTTTHIDPLEFRMEKEEEEERRHYVE